jgi:hypothetical protein
MPKIERWALVQNGKPWSNLMFPTRAAAMDYAQTWYGGASSTQIVSLGIRVARVTIE